MLVVLSVFISILSLILLTYYYYYYYYYYCCYYFYYSYFLIFILENLRTVNDIESAKATGIRPGQKLCHKCRITILKSEQDSCMQIDNNDQDYESPEEIANNDPDYELPKELCRENVNQGVESLLFSPMKPVSNQYIVAYGKRKLDQVLNSSSELIASALDLSTDELT